MPKLSKSLKHELRDLSEHMLFEVRLFGRKQNQGYRSRVVEFDFSNRFKAHPDFSVRLELETDSKKLAVGFMTGGKRVGPHEFFSDKQMDKLDPLWFDVFVFDYEEADKKLFKMLKYLYKNHA